MSAIYCRRCGGTPETCAAAGVKCCPDCTHDMAVLAPALLRERNRLQAKVARLEAALASRQAAMSSLREIANDLAEKLTAADGWGQ